MTLQVMASGKKKEGKKKKKDGNKPNNSPKQQGHQSCQGLWEGGEMVDVRLAGRCIMPFSNSF